MGHSLWAHSPKNLFFLSQSFLSASKFHAKPINRERERERRESVFKQRLRDRVGLKFVEAMAKEEASSVVSDLISFLNSSPTAFHAVGNYSHSLFSILLSVCFLRKSPTREQKILYLKKKKKNTFHRSFLVILFGFQMGFLYFFG